MACSAVFCTSRTVIKSGVKDRALSFHTFPKCPEIRNLWIKALRRENWEPTKYARLCSKHFKKSSFISGLSVKKLKTDAVPTIFEGYPQYHQPRRSSSKNKKVKPSSTALNYKTSNCTDHFRRIEHLEKQVQRLTNLVKKRLRKIKTLTEICRRLRKKSIYIFKV